ncbi:cysteine-rich repeat secretory protein 55-like [Zingiber officinale]|uniref:Gnk2-homologous domain-containing protein n=1 Tax=Zingiber officinale TaxID=94328 RepID=A0A8J5KBV0_ZINOF|nr:cysteine-rich repeat secretory protein 55-like [Zingiber officinale]KAG6483390.1 hypothetical protein ZIOFF_060035 [Zingiber officinale]
MAVEAERAANDQYKTGAMAAMELAHPVNSIPMALACLFVFVSLFFSCSSSASTYLGHHCSHRRRPHQQPSANVSFALDDLVAKASAGGFATGSYCNGSPGRDAVYGLAQCRGDVGWEDCASCLLDAAGVLRAHCADLADAMVGFDYCVMRFDDRDFIGEGDTQLYVLYPNPQFADEPEPFDRAVGEVMRGVRAQAAAPGSGGLGRGKVDVGAKTGKDEEVEVYGLAQCTRDLQLLTCARCLAAAEEKLREGCRYRKGCQVVLGSCIARYETYSFFFPLTGDEAAREYSKAMMHP